MASKRQIIQIQEKVPLSKGIPLSIQHTFAMFSASVLVPYILGISPSIALLMNGIGTLIFIFVTRGGAPAYLGSSFAFISPALIVISQPDLGYRYALGGFVVTGLLMCLVAGIIKFVGTRWIDAILPPAAMGPIVALIGLELAGSAAQTAGITITPTPTPLPTKIVCIDPGHQAEEMTDTEPNGPNSTEMKQKVTSGAYGEFSGKNEYEINLEVSLKLRDILVSRGYTVVMTRETHDVTISNVERAQIATAANANIFIRIHCNDVDESEVNGVLCYGPASDNTYLPQEIIENSQRLCEVLRDNQCAVTGQKALNNLYQNDMTGINWASMPVSIVEMGFMSNETEDLFLASEEGQNQIAEGLANGVDAYFAG